MAKLAWDEVGKRYYEAGVSKGVLFPYVNGTYAKGVAWNGLINVTESPSGAEATPLYADDIKYLNLMSTEEFGGTIEAYTYPDEFAQCDGTAEVAVGVSIGQQARTPFGFAYVTKIGNDTEFTNHGYKIHIVYNALASPSEKAYGTINNDPEAITFSWEFTTTPVEVDAGDGKTFKPTASVTIDSTKVDPTQLAELEKMLYGTEEAEPTLPTVDDIVRLFA